MLNRLSQARQSLRGKKVQEMINLEENDAQLANAAKFIGKIQVDDTFLINMALANVKGWKDLWKEIKKIDTDKNGLIEINDFELMMRDYFP